MNFRPKALHPSLLLLALLGVSSTASAQEDPGVIGEPTYTTEAGPEAAPPPPPPEPQPAQGPQLTQPTMTVASVSDGPRFRGGVAFTLGGEGVPDANYNAIMAGIDGRFGVQINDLIGVYLASHLSFGGKRGAGVSGTTGTFAVLAMADVTLQDAFFFGAGFGYIVFNNPSGPALGLRAGWYPTKSVSDATVRRKGLMLSVESRIGFVEDGFGNRYTAWMAMGAVGYEAF